MLLNVVYAWSGKLADLTWTQIKQYGDAGLAQRLFTVGDTKSDGNYTCRLVGFHQDMTGDTSENGWPFETSPAEMSYGPKPYTYFSSNARCI